MANRRGWRYPEDFRRAAVERFAFDTTRRFGGRRKVNGGVISRLVYNRELSDPRLDRELCHPA
jgi:hypothetical protein